MHLCLVAVVTLLINDAKTKEDRDTTVAVLGKGSSFGVKALTLFFYTTMEQFLNECRR